MIWLFTWIGLAFAQQEPTTGHVFFDASPGAEVVVFPRTQPSVIELGVYRNRVPINPQLKGLRAPLVADMDALSVGGGTSFLTLHLERDDVVIVPSVEGGLVTLRLSPGRVPQAEPPMAPTLTGILEHLDFRRPARPPRVALSPLRGDASATLPDAALQSIEIPPWFMVTQNTRYGIILRDSRASMAQIDRLREVLTESQDAELIEQAQYRLAQAHLTLKMPREAGYYARSLLADPQEIPPETAELLAAQSNIAARRWDDARSHCVRAADAGARKAETLRCLAVVSLATGYPSPSHVARALQRNSGDPHVHLLAAQLLQKDNRHAEALPALEKLMAQLEKPDSDAWLALGDAQYMTRDVDAALVSWSNIRPGDAHHRVARMRRRMGRLIGQTRGEWAQEIPTLTALSEREGTEGAEAAYLLGQIAQSQGDVGGAAEHYTKLWRDHRELSLRADVPERLLLVCNERLNQLHRARRTVDEVAVFDSCWNEDLDVLSSSTETLERMAQVLVGLGLPEAALHLQQRALHVHTVTEREDGESLLALAELYTENDRYREALDTLTYLDKHAPSKDRVRRHLAQADAHLGNDEISLAERAYRKAIRADPKRDLPRRKLGLLLSKIDRCPEAIPLLAGDDNTEASLAESRCLLDVGRSTAAHLAASSVLDQTDDQWTAEHAAWLASVAALDADPTPPLPGPDEPVTPLWRALLGEEQAIAALKSRLIME